MDAAEGGAHPFLTAHFLTPLLVRIQPSAAQSASVGTQFARTKRWWRVLLSLSVSRSLVHDIWHRRVSRRRRHTKREREREDLLSSLSSLSSCVVLLVRRLLVCLCRVYDRVSGATRPSVISCVHANDLANVRRSCRLRFDPRRPRDSTGRHQCDIGTVTRRVSLHPATTTST